jgi:tRNA A-37 threonylcarbamoyl transferase component Bud32
MGMMLSPASARLGRYELISYLGSGGMSDVYVALHTGLRKRFALKLLRPALRSNEEAVQRFLREGECAARVSHPNVVDVSDVGTDDGVPYLVMELLEGETLANKLARDGKLAIESALDILLPIFDAVATAHAAGVLHRDLKPSNILLSRGPDGSMQPKLLDFGIAELSCRSERSQGPIGTPFYMSPEQARSEPLDARSDLYSLGSVLFEMLTGHEPYRSEHIEQVLALVARGNFPPLERARTDAPLALAAVLARMTARTPQQRYDTVAEAARALVPFASARTRRLWLAREQRLGESAMRVWSGAFRVPPPVVVAPHVGPRASDVRRERRVRQRSFAGGALLLGLGLCTGLWVTHGEAEALGRDLGTQEPAPGALSADVGAAQLAVRLARTVRVTPDSAEITLDGVVLGHGAAELPELGDRLHQLRITASGYVDRVFLFHGSLPDRDIRLDAR